MLVFHLGGLHALPTAGPEVGCFEIDYEASATTRNDRPAPK